MNEDKDKEGQEGEVIEQIVTEKVIVDVKRGVTEKELTEDLMKERAETEKERTEKEKLVEQLDELNKELQNMKDTKEQDDTKFTDLEKEKTDAVDKLTAIALEEFEKEKDAKMNKLLEAGLPEEKVDELKERIQSPLDFEVQQFYLDFITEQLEKGKQAEVDAQQQAQQVADDVAAKEGTTVQSPPVDSQVPLVAPKEGEPTEFETYKDMMDDISRRRAEGDPKAEAEYNALWEKAGPTLKQMMREGSGFTVIGCPRCDKGIFKRMQKCPYCGFDLVEFRVQGGELI